MTYHQARSVMEAGGCVYRPYWEAGTYLRLEGLAGRRRIVRYAGNQPVGIWVAEPEDFGARDWETEYFVSLAVQPEAVPVMQ